MSDADPFAALDLPRTQALDPEDVERRFRERARRVHPDRFARAGAAERRRAAEETARLTDALRTVRDPLSRAEALLRLAGRDPLRDRDAAPGAEFLEAQLADREALRRARDAGDAAEAARIADAASAALDDAQRALARLLSPGAPAAALDAAARLLVRARFHARLAADAKGDVA